MTDDEIADLLAENARLKQQVESLRLQLEAMVERIGADLLALAETLG